MHGLEPKSHSALHAGRLVETRPLIGIKTWKDFLNFQLLISTDSGVLCQPDSSIFRRLEMNQEEFCSFSLCCTLLLRSSKLTTQHSSNHYWPVFSCSCRSSGRKCESGGSANLCTKETQDWGCAFELWATRLGSRRAQSSRSRLIWQWELSRKERKRISLRKKRPVLSQKNWAPFWRRRLTNPRRESSNWKRESQNCWTKTETWKPGFEVTKLWVSFSFLRMSFIHSLLDFLSLSSWFYMTLGIRSQHYLYIELCEYAAPRNATPEWSILDRKACMRIAFSDLLVAFLIWAKKVLTWPKFNAKKQSEMQFRCFVQTGGTNNLSWWFWQR